MCMKDKKKFSIRYHGCWILTVRFPMSAFFSHSKQPLVSLETSLKELAEASAQVNGLKTKAWASSLTRSIREQCSIWHSWHPLNCRPRRRGSCVFRPLLCLGRLIHEQTVSWPPYSFFKPKAVIPPQTVSATPCVLQRGDNHCIPLASGAQR